jgi:predicted DNA-binding transcriptional regulator AlpA
MARPTKYQGINSPIVKKLIEGFKNDFTIEESCYYAGISKQTFYNWKEQNKEFLDEIEASQSFLIMEAKKILKKSMLEGGKFEQVLKFLQKRQPKIYEPLLKKEDKKENNFIINWYEEETHEDPNKKL